MVRMSLALWFQHTKQVWRPYKIDSVVKKATPGLGCPPKLWWVKEITPDLHVSGRLTGRQLKYAAEGGFKSVVCLDPDKQMTFAGETLPNSSDIKSISSLIGIQTSFINTVESVPDSKSVDHLTDIFPNLSKPLLLTGGKEKNATFLALLYLAHQSKGELDSVPKLSSHDIYRIAASMGFDFSDEVSKRIVAEVTGEDVVADPTKPDLENVPVSNYWPAHRIGKNWYTAGQIRRQDLPFLESAGFKSLINMRMGVEYANKPSQEPVTLLNIKDSLWTYDEAKNPTRLNPKILEENRVFPEISPEYVGHSSSSNYETTNEEEFGDSVGYNEDIERDFVEKHSALKYSHMPFPLPTKDAYNREQFEEFKDELMSADKDGPVLLHCRIGKRVAYFGILALAMKEGRSLEWAQKRSIEMGHEVSPEARPDVYKVYAEYLKSE